MLCTGAGEVQTLGGNAQTLEDEANADVADTLIDDALGELLPCCPATCPPLHMPRCHILQNVGLGCKVHVLQ